MCHIDIGRRLAAGEDEEQIEEEGQQCVGMMRYLNGMCKLAHRPEVAEFQKLLRTIDDQPVIAPRKFREHHEQGLKKRKANRK